MEMNKVAMNDEQMDAVSGGSILPYRVQPGDSLDDIEVPRDHRAAHQVESHPESQRADRRPAAEDQILIGRTKEGVRLKSFTPSLRSRRIAIRRKKYWTFVGREVL